MFLSKVSLKQGPELLALLGSKKGADGYAAHKLLWDLFPNDGKKTRDFLFHKEERNGLPTFYLLSHEEPVSNPAFNLQTKPFSPKLSRGCRLAFTLIANPVVARKREGNRHSAKHDVWMDAKKQAKEKGLAEGELIEFCENSVKEWLIRQGSRSGFEICKKEILIDGYLQNCFYKGKGIRPIRFSSIHFEGVLTVTDPDVFVAMLGKGLGKSKAFGCGLMLIRRI